MKEGKNILLVISSERDWEKPASEAIKIAEKKSYNLYILFVIEDKRIYYLNRMNEAEFMSKKMSAELTEALLREKRQIAYSALEKIIANASPKGIKIKSTVLSGDIVSLTIKFAKEIPADEIVLSWHQESFVGKFFKGDPVEDIREVTGLPVLAVTE